MGKKKSRRKTKGKSEKEEEDFDVGDEEAQLKTKFGTIGEDDDDFYEDEVDKFHKDEDKILLDKAGGKLIDDDDSEAEEGVKEVLKFDEDSDDDDDESDEEMSQMIKIQMNRLKRQGKGLELESEDDEEEDEEEDEKKKQKDDKAGTWGGTKSSAYYGADHVESDESDDEETEDAQRLEYEEAMLIQKRIESKFDEDDFGLDLLQTATTTPSTTAAGDGRRLQPKDDATIHADLSQLSKTEKVALLKKESPEFLGLVKDYRDKLIELRDRVQPLFDLVREGKIPSTTSGGAADFVRLKYKTLAGYCVNLSFYLMLKAKKASVVDHPVVKRLLQYKRTMLELEPLDEKLGGEIDRILKMVSEGKDLRPKATAAAAVDPAMSVEEGTMDEGDGSYDDDDDDDDSPVGTEADDDDEFPDELPSNGGRGGGKKRKKATSDAPQHSIRDDVEAKLKKMKKLKTSDLNDETTEADEDKRKATKEMEKNRGLTPHKRKDLKNPRVRLREKYRKAKIRRKGAVRDQRFEAGNYGGEASGIRAGLKKGIKIL